MNIIAMIPARYAASRFPGKLMQDLGGKSVIMRTYEAAVHSALFQQVYVVTDSEIIYNEIISNGGCLLYTSDAADDSLRVDLGGRRIIKKIFFKQKTAYEISACLVGSEMCIRDSKEMSPF